MSDAAPHAAPTLPTSPPEAVATLRRLKDAETQAQRALEATRQQGEARVRDAHIARDRALAAARQEAEALRVRRLQEARNQPDAQKVISAAQVEAGKLGDLTPQEIDQRTEEILATVLGDFRAPPSKPASPAAR
jgi:vacuolar-type H+-ATPase subunit H